MLIWENINILKTHKTFAYLIKGTVLGRTSWGADTFPTRNRLPDPNSGFSQTLLFLWFSIVSYNNYGGDSKLCFYKFLFLVRRPVAISVVTDGDSTGDVRESDHLFGRAKLMWFFFIFFLSHFFLVCVFYFIFFYI